ncbi:MAG: hypothetical protein M3Q63_03370 [bacterium]|nr:hypothetical protein [bacterium]
MAVSQNKKGSLMLEICLSIALFTIIISYTSLSLSGITSASGSIESSRTLLYKHKEYLENAIAAEKTMVFESTSEFITLRNSTPCRTILSTPLLFTLIVDSVYKEAIGHDCGGTEPLLSNSPQSKVSTSFGTTTAFDVVNNKAFITRSSASSTEVNFIIADLDKDMLEISRLSTGNNFNTIDVTSEYAYIAARGTENQFHIINIQDPYNPILSSKTSLPGVAGSYPDAISIFYYNSKVYIGTHRTAGREFHIFDVASPANPKWLGSLEVNHNINAIAVRGNYAYLATSGNTKDLIVLNIENPSRIAIASSLSFLGNEDTLSLHLLGNTLYSGRAKSIDKNHPEIVILNIQNPLQPLVTGSIHIGAKIENLKMGGTTLYTSVIGPKPGLYSFSVTSMASTTAQIITPSKIPIVDIDYEDKKLYTLSQSGVITKYE